MQSLPELMSQIVIQSKGLSKNLDALNLSQEAKRAFNPLITEYMNTGDVKAFDAFMNMKGDGSTTLNDAAVAASDFAASLQLVSNSWSQFSNQQLAGPVADLADAINSLDAGAVQQWLEAGKNIALVTGGLVLAKKTFDAVRWGKETWDALKPGKVGKGGAGALGGAIADLGATPVYVVNMPVGGFDIPTGGPDSPKGKLPKSIQFAKTVAPFLLRGALPFTALYAASQSEHAQALKTESDNAQNFRSTLPQSKMLSNSDAYAILASEMTPTSPSSPTNPYALLAAEMLEAQKGLSGGSLGGQNPVQPSSSLDVTLHYDRPPTVSVREKAPGMRVNVDTGPSLMP